MRQIPIRKPLALLQQHRRRDLDPFLVKREPKFPERLLRAIKNAQLFRNLVRVVDQTARWIEQQRDLHQRADLCNSREHSPLEIREFMKAIDVDSRALD